MVSATARNKTKAEEGTSLIGTLRSVLRSVLHRQSPNSEWVSGTAANFPKRFGPEGLTPHQNSELGDGDSLPVERLPPPASAINSREGGESAALDLNGVTASDAWGPNNRKPNPTEPASSIRVLTLSAVMDRGEICVGQGIKDGEIVAVIILLASVRLVERYDDDLAS